MWWLLAMVVAQAGASADVDDAGADAGAPDAVPALTLRFEGNLVPTALYEHVVSLPDGAAADAETARLVATQVLQFLQASGYELAEVSVSRDAGGLTVYVDEGQLEKVVFCGRFSLPMLRFRLALDLPKDVYNRQHLEREVARRSAELGLASPTWELVAAEGVVHDGVQLSTSPGLVLAGRGLFHPRHAHELHFTFGEPAWSTGVGFDLRTSWLDGLEVRLNYQGRSVALRDDRWRFGVTAGLGLRNDLPRGNIYAFPSRVTADIRWYSMPLDARGSTRALLRARVEGVFRQRRDFGLENYTAMRTELSANLASRPHPVVAFTLSAGFEYFRVGGFAPDEGQRPRCRPGPSRRRRASTSRRACAPSGAGASTSPSSTETRGGTAATCSASRVASRATSRTRFDLPLFVDLRLNYQLVVPFGWHDLWFRVLGTWMSGDVLFPFEEVMGEHLPAVFGDVWLRKVAGLRVEYRYSLVRDTFKVGVFANGLAFAEEHHDLDLATPRFGFGAGPTAHFLIADFVQLDLFLKFAVLSNGRFSTGLLVWVNKVF